MLLEEGSELAFRVESRTKIAWIQIHGSAPM